VWKFGFVKFDDNKIKVYRFLPHVKSALVIQHAVCNPDFVPCNVYTDSIYKY